jgi:hypothetical protein
VLGNNKSHRLLQTRSGGKLISMLMVGPTVRRAWEHRYADAASEIASAVAGRPLRREARLGAIFTTSLYGRGAQYNRIALPSLRPDRAGPRYAFIGNTIGFGTTHIRPQTAAALSQLVAVARGGERLHSLFGEGVSPRLRRLREGLDRLGLPSEQLLQHGEARAVYAIALGDRATAWLRGEADDPQLYDEGIDPPIGDAALLDHWRQRWLRPRLARPDALAPLRAHRLTLPLRHGARVVLPPLDDE